MFGCHSVDVSCSSDVIGSTSVVGVPAPVPVSKRVVSAGRDPPLARRRAAPETACAVLDSDSSVDVSLRHTLEIGRKARRLEGEKASAECVDKTAPERKMKGMKKRRRLSWAMIVTAITITAFGIVKIIQPTEAVVEIAFLGTTNNHSWNPAERSSPFSYLKDESKTSFPPVVPSDSTAEEFRQTTHALLQISNGAGATILLDQLMMLGRFANTNGLENPGSDVLDAHHLGSYGTLAPGETKTVAVGLRPGADSWRAVLVYERWGTIEQMLTAWLPRLPDFAQSWLKDNTLTLRKAAVPFSTVAPAEHQTAIP